MAVFGLRKRVSDSTSETPEVQFDRDFFPSNFSRPVSDDRSLFQHQAPQPSQGLVGNTFPTNKRKNLKYV